MKFETTKSNKKLLLFVVIIFVVILTLIISTSLAKYKVTESIKLVEGTINYSLSDLNVLAIYNDKVRASSTLRISLSHLTTTDEINKFIEYFEQIYRKLSGLHTNI